MHMFFETPPALPMLKFKSNTFSIHVVAMQLEIMAKSANNPLSKNLKAICFKIFL